jgi:hypothetical protein
LYVLNHVFASSLPGSLSDRSDLLLCCYLHRRLPRFRRVWTASEAATRAPPTGLAAQPSSGENSAVRLACHEAATRSIWCGCACVSNDVYQGTLDTNGQNVYLADTVRTPLCPSLRPDGCGMLPLARA